MDVKVAQARPDSADAVALITELDGYLCPLYPKWNQSGLSPDRLVREGVAFFIVYVDGAPAGCGCIKPDEGIGGSGELKRMYVRPRYRGQGLGRLMLDHLESFARQHGITILRLETGVYQPEAMRLYERMGYRPIPPFPPYDVCTGTLSRFYEKRLAPGP
jgi:GNAT superfamily N-acetyltransferase